MAIGYPPRERYLAWLRGPWRVLDFDDHKVDEGYRVAFRSDHAAAAERIAGDPRVAGARPYARCECCDTVVIRRDESYLWTPAMTSPWRVADDHSALTMAIGSHGELRADPYRFDWYTELAMSPFKVFRSGTVADMLTGDPILQMGMPFPSRDALNDLLSSGQFGGGMSQGAQFAPVALSAVDYEAVAAQVRIGTPWLSETIAPDNLATMADFGRWWRDRLAGYPQHRHDAFRAELRAVLRQLRRSSSHDRERAQAELYRHFRRQDLFLAADG